MKSRLGLAVVIHTTYLRILNYAIALAVSIMIARALGPTGRGEYYFPILLANTLLLLFHFSIEHANIFLLSSRRATVDQLSTNGGMIAGVGGVIAIGVGLLALVVRPNLAAGVPGRLFVAALLPLPLMIHQVYVTGLLVLSGKVVEVQRNTVFAGLFQTLCLVVLWAFEAVDPLAVIIVTGATTVVSWALMAHSMVGTGSLRPRWDGQLVRLAFSFGLRIHAGAIFLFLNLRVDAYLVKLYAGLTALGLYSLATTLAELVWLVTDSLAMAILQRQTASDFGAGAALTARACRVSLLIATVVGIGLASGGYPLIAIGYGREYTPVVGALVLLLPGIVLGAQWRPLGAYLVKLGRPTRISVLNGGGAVLNILFNIILVPRIGINGAALATTISYTVVTVAYAVWFCRVSATPFGRLLLASRRDFGNISFVSALLMGRTRAAGGGAYVAR